MARIRTIKPEFWNSLQIAECSTTARLLFIGLWTFCDDAGIHVADCRRVKMQIFPGDAISVEQIRGWINELLSAKLLVEYEADHESQAMKFWQVTGWHHQRIDRPSFKYPPPPENYSTNGSAVSSNGSANSLGHSTNFPLRTDGRTDGRKDRSKSTDRSGRRGEPVPDRTAFFEEQEVLRQAMQVPVEPKPCKAIKQSVFATIEERDLSSTAFLVEWHARQLTAAEPVMGATEADLLVVIAAALWASEHRKVERSRVGMFIDALTKRRYRQLSRFLTRAKEALQAHKDQSA